MSRFSITTVKIRNSLCLSSNILPEYIWILYRDPQKTSVIIITEFPGQDSTTLSNPRTSFSQMVSLPLLCLFSRVAQNSDPDEINKLLTCPQFIVAKVPTEDQIDPLDNSRYQMLWITYSSVLSITEFREKASCSLFPSKPWISFEIITPCHRFGQAISKGRPSSLSYPYPGP